MRKALPTGKSRIIKKFAFFPVTINFEQTIWWETYYEIEHYHYLYGGWYHGDNFLPEEYDRIYDIYKDELI